MTEDRGSIVWPAHKEVSTAVIVAPSPVPLRIGGAERHWNGLREALENAGVATDLVKLPVRERTLPDLLEAYEAFLCLDLSHADLVISGKYPAWMVQHPNHLVWMLHPLRGLYDTYGPATHEGDEPLAGDDLAALGDLLAPPTDATPLEVIDAVRGVFERLGPRSVESGGPLALPGPVARSVVHFLDRWALDRRRIRRHLTISEVVAARPDYLPANVRPEVILPPSCLADPSPSAVPGNTLGSGPTTGSDNTGGAPARRERETRRYLAVGRLDRPKRMDLAIEGFTRFTEPDARLTIVGDGPDRRRLEQSAQDRRIAFTGHITDEELEAAYRGARAVLVTPAEEDFGYVTIEALQAGRPVITTTDSGGPAELVTDRIDALVVAPDPGSISAALAELDRDDALAQRLGESARATAAAHSWHNVARELLTDPPARLPSSGSKGRIAALSTYPVADWPGGGPERARKLLGALAARGWEIELVAISPDDAPHVTEVVEGFTEVRAPLSRRHIQADRNLRRLTANVAVSDITAAVLWSSSPQLVQAAISALEGADGVVAVQPYLIPMVRELAPDVPLVFDDHNHELTLKTQMLPDDEAGRWMLRRVAEAEGTGAREARLTVATTPSDARVLEHDHGLEPGSVLVVPNGVDTDAVKPSSEAERRESRRRLVDESVLPEGGPTIALFVGSAHQPNIDAARDLISIAPGLPEVLFILAGEHSEKVDSQTNPDNVLCVGSVSDADLHRLLAATDIALNPMRSGSGSNLKVLNYFAAGVPVVATPTGMRGIPDPQSVAEVASIDRFEEAIRSVIADSNSNTGRAKVEARIAAARGLVEADYNWLVLSELFADRVIHAICAEGPQPLEDDP